MRNSLRDTANLWRKLALVREEAKWRGLTLPELPQATTPAREAFRKRYKNDPVRFVRECIVFDGGGPTDYQIEILEKIIAHGRVAVRSPHGTGKTALAAWLTLWFALTRDGAIDWKVVTTASVWRQLKEYLWPEIHKWSGRLRWEKIGRAPFELRRELQDMALRLETGSAFAVASDKPDLIEGAHASALLYVFDEAKAILDGTFDAAEGAFSGAGRDTIAEAYALAISTPGPPRGRFYDIHARRRGYEDWAVRHVTRDEAIAAGRMSAEWAEQRRKQWGEQSAVYRNRVLGEFAAGEESSVIPLEWVEAAIERWHARGGEFGELSVIGVDVARGGEDMTVMALRHGNSISRLYKHNFNDTMTVVGRVMRIGGGTRAIVDVVGVGAGVVDRLRELGCDVVAFNAGARCVWTDSSGEVGFADMRSWAWWHMRELLDPANGYDIALPPDDELVGDLTAPEWSETSAGRIRIESKESIRKRLGRSTDCGDAVVMAFADYFGAELPSWCLRKDIRPL